MISHRGVLPQAGSAVTSVRRTRAQGWILAARKVCAVLSVLSPPGIPARSMADLAVGITMRVGSAAVMMLLPTGRPTSSGAVRVGEAADLLGYSGP